MDLNEVAKLIVRGSAIYHLIMGTACVLSINWIAKLGLFLYKLKAPAKIDPRFEYGLKPLGAFALVFSAWSFRAGWFSQSEELNYYKICFAILLILRSGFRFLYQELFWEAFEVRWNRSRWNCIFNLILAVILLTSVFI